MPPQLNRKRALFVLTKIDEILAWEKPESAGLNEGVEYERGRPG